MSGVRLTLGPVAFGSFEVPERLTFGGAQKLAVHRLPGGARVIDAMGRDDADISWSGVLSGGDASDRFRVLDALRCAGANLTLGWDIFFYSVVVEKFEAEYASPWWIPYRISCKVIQDVVEAAAASLAGLAVAVTADLTVASGFLDVSGFQDALAVPSAATPGTDAYAQAMSAGTTQLQGINAQIDSAGGDFGAGDLPSTLQQSGQLAQLGAARGYVGRALANLGNADL